MRTHSEECVNRPVHRLALEQAVLASMRTHSEECVNFLDNRAVGVIDGASMRTHSEECVNARAGRGLVQRLLHGFNEDALRRVRE